MPKRKTPEPTHTPTSSDEDADRYRIERYRNTRHYALYDGEELVALMVYRKGAAAVRERLQACERTLAEYRQQRETLPLAADPPPSVASPFVLSAGSPLPQQLTFIAPQDKPAYRRTAPTRRGKTDGCPAAPTLP